MKKKKFQKIFSLLKNGFKRFQSLHNKLSKFDKKVVFILLGAIIALGVIKINIFIQNNTASVPTDGGNFQAVLVGKLNHPNPVLARSFVDRAVSALVYSGLTQIDASGNIKPLLAEGWAVPEEGKKYVFHLKKGLFWSDGVPVTAKDVEYTVLKIQDSLNQSPLLDNWQGVKVSIADDLTVEFSLEEKSAPFLSATTVGIIPSHLAFKDHDRYLIGFGPYTVQKAIINSSGTIGLNFEANPDWLDGRPWITNIDFQFADSLEQAENILVQSPDFSLAGRFYREPTKIEDHTLHAIPTNRKLILFINTGIDPLKNQGVRAKLLRNESQSISRELILLTDKKNAQNDKLKKLLSDWQKIGVKIKVNALEAGLLQEKINRREYDLLAVAIDFGTDKDLYPFFHSSQKTSNGLNFVNLEDADLNKLLEEARVNLDQAKRNDLQKQIEDRIGGQFLYREVDRETFYFQTSNQIKGFPEIKSLVNPEDCFATIGKWFINQKRVFKK